jgi:hypothetical protein
MPVPDFLWDKAKTAPTRITKTTTTIRYFLMKPEKIVGAAGIQPI